MNNLITDIPGILIGAAQDEKVASGVTVVLFEEPAVVLQNACEHRRSITLQARRKDQMMSPFDGADGVNLDESKPLDQSRYTDGRGRRRHIGVIRQALRVQQQSRRVTR